MSHGHSGRRNRGRRPVTGPLDTGELPREFRARMERLLGSEAETFLESLADPATGLRVNTLRTEPDAFARLAPFPLRPLPYPPEGFVVPEDVRPGAHPYHAAGLYYLQDPGAMVVGALPPLPPHARVLDLAAAPGGKATHLAARMRGQGVLVANDVSHSRARELAGNLERCGVTNAIVTSEAPERLQAAWGGWFDVVLVDAPCSGESMFHKSVAARQEWSPGAVAGCARRQEEVMAEAIGLVRPGGVLVYSTCTFSPEENEGVLAATLRRHPDLQVMELPTVPGASAGEPGWAGADAPPSLTRALRLWPHRVPGAGHFIAALRKGDDSAPDDAGFSIDPGRVAAPARPALARPVQPLPAAALQRMMAFLEAALPQLALESEQVVLTGDRLYLLPQETPPLDGVRMLEPGWWLGSDRKGRFEPSHALALGADPTLAPHRVELTREEPDVQAYLRGETLRRPGPDGWALVTVDGFALGWGKRSAGVLKNHYPKGLRRP